MLYVCPKCGDKSWDLQIRASKLNPINEKIFCPNCNSELNKEELKSTL